MILANTRQHLTRNDAQLAMRILAHGSDSELSELEARLSNDGIDAVLDDPRLPMALVKSSSGVHASFPLFAYVMVRHALRRLGEATDCSRTISRQSSSISECETVRIA